MKKLILLALVSLITLGVSAQQTKTASKGEQTVTIQTNGVCQKCADLQLRHENVEIDHQLRLQEDKSRPIASGNQQTRL